MITLNLPDSSTARRIDSPTFRTSGVLGNLTLIGPCHRPNASFRSEVDKIVPKFTNLIMRRRKNDISLFPSQPSNVKESRLINLAKIQPESPLSGSNALTSTTTWLLPLMLANLQAFDAREKIILSFPSFFVLPRSPIRKEVQQRMSKWGHVFSSKLISSTSHTQLHLALLKGNLLGGLPLLPTLMVKLLSCHTRVTRLTVLLNGLLLRPPGACGTKANVATGHRTRPFALIQRDGR